VALSSFGCVTEQLATLPETDDTRAALSHCLASLGFWEDRELLAEFGTDEPDLIAIWLMHSRGYSAAPGTTVWVSQSQGEFHLRFLPGAGEDNAGTAILTRSFTSCVPQHVGDVKVILRSRTYPDFR